jgi:hypothetical protein
MTVYAQLGANIIEEALLAVRKQLSASAVAASNALAQH